jgi:hypothetical protein
LDAAVRVGAAGEGALADGVVTDGTVATGVDAGGVVTDGTLTEGVVADGVVTRGVVAGGVVTEGVVPTGVLTEGTVAEGTVSCGTAEAAVCCGRIAAVPARGWATSTPSAAATIPSTKRCVFPMAAHNGRLVQNLRIPANTARKGGDQPTGDAPPTRYALSGPRPPRSSLARPSSLG